MINGKQTVSLLNGSGKDGLNGRQVSVSALPKKENELSKTPDHEL